MIPELNIVLLKEKYKSLLPDLLLEYLSANCGDYLLVISAEWWPQGGENHQNHVHIVKLFITPPHH